MMENNQSFGKRISELRKAKGLTQEQLGETLGVSAQAVSKWENDQSYPDISLLPRIGQFFDVSVDELLGLKPLDPKVIIVDKDDTRSKNANGSFNWEWQSGRWSTIASCIGMILICLFFILHSMAGMFPYINDGKTVLTAWSYIWPILVFTLGLVSVRYHIVSGTIIMLLGAYEFIRKALIPSGITLITIPWYVVLLVLAIIVLVRTILRNVRPKAYHKAHNGKNRVPVMDVSFEDDFLRADMSFGSGTVDYDRDALRGGEVDTNFGDYTIDLTKVKTFTDGCLLELDNNFGNLTVLLPRTVRLTKSTDNSFASFSVTGNPDADAPYNIIISSDTNFGSVQVRYE